MGKIDNERIQYLVKEYQASGENKYYEELNEKLANYATRLMAKFAGSGHAVRQIDERESIIHNALFDALRRYDPGRKTKFTTLFYYTLKEKYYDRLLENARILSAPRGIKKTSMQEISLELDAPGEVIRNVAAPDTNTFDDDEYTRDFLLFLEEGQREALKIFLSKPHMQSYEKKEAKVYVNRERIRVIYRYFTNLQSNESERAIYLIGIKRIIVDNIHIAVVTREVNDALGDYDFMKKEMSAALLYVFYHLKKRYPVLDNPDLENRLYLSPQEENLINPIKLEIVTNIIRKEVEKCLRH